MSLMDEIKKIGQLGGFGDIIFTVNPLQIMTFQKVTRKRSVEYAQHRIIRDKPKLEATFDNADEVTIELLLSSSLGIDPSEELQKFNYYMKSHQFKKLIIGNALQGSNVWGDYVITNIDETYEEVSTFGVVTRIGLNVSFLEYN